MDCPLVLGINLQEGPKVGDADEQLSSRADLEKPSLEAEDEAAVPPPPSASCAGACSYHIVYSASYAVPVLLFDARDPGALVIYSAPLCACVLRKPPRCAIPFQQRRWLLHDVHA